RHRFDQSLPCRIPDRFRNASSSPHGVSPVALRLLAFQDSFSPDGFDEMMALQNHIDFLMNRPIKRLSHGDDGFNGSLMFEGERVSRAQAAMEGSYAEDSLRGVSLRNDALMFEEKRVSRALATKEVSYPEDCVKSCNSLPANLDAMEASYPKRSNSLPANLACMVNRSGPRTLIVRVLTSKPLDLIQICLNNYGTRVVKKMIEEVFTFRRTFSWTYITLAYFDHVHETFRADCKLPEQLFATDRFRRSDSIWSVLSTLIRVVRGRKRVVSNIGDVVTRYVVSILCFLTTQIPDEVFKVHYQQEVRS
ncbi:hypothetical protein HID58_079917, partial [Brassica napus]